MTRHLVLLIVCLLGSNLPLPALPLPGLFAQTIDGEMISPQMADRCGLERAWFTHVQVAPSRGRIIDIQLHVSSEQSLTVFEVVAPDETTRVFSERDLDNFGDQIGAEAAEQQANEHADQLKSTGIEAVVERRVIPETTLYAVTDHGLMQAIDARTGATRWTVSFGQTRYPTTRPAISEDYVAISNGSQLFMLDSANGQVIWKRRSESIPTVTGSFAGYTLYIPMLNGQISSFEVRPQVPKWPQVYYTRGTVHYAPSVIGRSVVWASDAGDISVATVGVSGLRYRLALPYPSAGKITTKYPRTLFAAGQRGSIYSLDLADGAINWELSTGYEMDTGPIYVAESLFMPTKRKGMFALQVDTGDPLWKAPNITRFAATGNGKVFAVNRYHELVVLDAKQGHRHASTSLGLSDQVLANTKTDWIFIATQRGLVYCLRPLGSPWPTIYQQRLTSEQPDEEAETSPADSDQPEPEAPQDQPVDPFGGLPDPLDDQPTAAEPVPNPAAGDLPGNEPPANDAPADDPDDPFN